MDKQAFQRIKLLRMLWIPLTVLALLISPLYGWGNKAAAATNYLVTLGDADAMNLQNPTLLSGAAGAVNSKYRYENAISKNGIQVDVIATIEKITNGAKLASNKIDADTAPIGRFNPQISTPNNGEGSIQFKFEFIEHFSTAPVLIKNFYLTAVDIDGSNSVQEFIEASGFTRYRIDESNQLTINSSTGGRTRFSGVHEDLTGIKFDNKAAVIAEYSAPISSISIVTGITGKWTSTSRLFSLSFGAPDFRNEAEADSPPFPDPVDYNNQNSPTINVEIVDVDGKLMAPDDDLKNVVIKGTTNAEDGQPVSIIINGTNKSEVNFTTIVEDGKYEYSADLSSLPPGSITVGASVINKFGNPSLIATDSSTIVNSPPTASDVEIKGSKTVGDTLTGSYTYGDADNDLTGTPEYKWYRDSQASGTNKVEINGATTSSYTLTTDDADKYIFFEVTPKAATGTPTGTPVVSPGYGPIVPANVAPVATDDTKKTNMNTALTGTLPATDADTGDTLTFSKVSNPLHGTVTVNTNGSYTYTPTTGYTGTDSFTFKASDGKADSNVATVTITVNAPPTASDVEIKGSKTVGDTLTGSYTYGDADNDLTGTPEYKWYRDSQASGTNKLEINGATTSSYTLTTDDADKYIFFELTPKAATGTPTGTPVVSAGFGPIVPANVAPVATDDTKKTNMNTALTGTLPATDANTGDTLTFSKVSNPLHGTVTVNADGTYTYTPTTGYTGTDSFTFKVSDGKADSNVATVTITVNAPPTASDVEIKGSKTVGDTLTGSYTYGDADNDLTGTPEYKWYRDSQASGTNKVEINGATTSSYTLTTDDADKYIFFEVTPKAASGTPTGTPVVSAGYGPIIPANVAPVATDDTKKTNMNTALTGTLPATDANTGDTLTFSKASNPSHGTVTVNADGTYTYTPTTGYTGTDSFTFKVSDGKADSNVATVTITVNAPPTASDVEIKGSKTVGDTLTGSYTYGDADNDLTGTPEYKWYRDSLASGTNKVEINGATTSSYTLTTDDADKYIFFEVTPKAASGTPTGTPVVSAGYGPIIPANVAPVATDDTKKTNMNTALTGTLPATDANTGDTLTFSKVSNPLHGTVTVNSNGSYTYTPNDGYVGTDSFTFKAYDGKAYSNVATVTITVENRKPVALAHDVIISVNGAVYDGKLHGSDADSGDTLTFAKASDPEHGTVTIDADTGTYKYQPTPGYSGQDSFTFTVTDSHGATSAPAKVTIVIAEPGTYVIRLVADPDTLIGDGKSTTQLTATLLDSENNPVPGVTVKFGATSGTFPDGYEAVTNESGQAVILYKTSKISSTVSQVIPVTADVHDTEKGIYSHQQIDVTFQPAAIRGVVASTANGERIVEKGVKVRISNAEIGFSAETTTDELGQYAIPVPEGDLVYSIEIIKPVTVGGETKEVSFKQTAKVGEITGGGEEYFDSEKVATGIIVLAKPDGSQKLLNEQDPVDRDMAAQLKIKILDPDTGEFITVNGQDAFALDPSGVFSIPGLVKGKKYGLAIVYSLPDAQGGGAAKEIIMNAVDNDGTLPKFELSADGELNILDELIDPYGDITDKVTNAAVDGAHVVLYYADTPRNRAAGITPGTEVVLPAIAGFGPNDNANPQTSKSGGKYAYMVYPQTDYYLVVTATGYDTYVSPTIPVEFAIVRHDVPLTPQTSTPSPGGPTGPSTPAEPEQTGKPDLIVNVTIDRSTYEESSTATVTVQYKNDGDAAAKDAEITLAIPAGAEVLDAAGGMVSEGKIVWKPGTVDAAAGGKYVVKLKWPQIDAAERMAELDAKASAANLGAEDAANAEASAKLLIFSNRYGNVSHTRYILGYPDKKFLPNRTLTRAELAAIIARLIDGGGTTLKAQYSDVRTGHWASGYIRIASDNGIFTGYTDGSFHPDSPVTREELAAVMVRYLKLKVAKPLDSKFADAEGRWSSAAIEALFRNALTTGYEDGTFKPSAPIVRQEAVTMINRLLYRGPLGGVEASFPDVPASSWSFGQIEEATRSHESVRAADGSEIYAKSIEDNVQ